jgi:hypothetical protein
MPWMIQERKRISRNAIAWGFTCAASIAWFVYAVRR